MAIWAISDIKGQRSIFKALLEKAGFDNKKDQLFILGNFMGDTQETVMLTNEIMEKTKKEIFFPLKGITEEYFVRGLLLDQYICAENLFESNSIALHYYRNMANNIYIKQLKFLSKLPYSYETKNYYFSSIGKTIKENINFLMYEDTERLVEEIPGKLHVYSHYDSNSICNEEIYYEDSTNSLCINNNSGGSGNGTMNLINLSRMELYSSKYKR